MYIVYIIYNIQSVLFSKYWAQNKLILTFICQHLSLNFSLWIINFTSYSASYTLGHFLLLKPLNPSQQHPTSRVVSTKRKITLSWIIVPTCHLQSTCQAIIMREIHLCSNGEPLPWYALWLKKTLSVRNPYCFYTVRCAGEGRTGFKRNYRHKWGW